MLSHRALVSGSLVAAYLVLGSGSHYVTPPKPDSKRALAEFASSIPRKIYRYSVVPGGVYTPDELAAARRIDAAVAAHFADFGTDTRVTTLKQDLYVYVSYRIGGKIYYSKKKHKVCKGELVLTDGKNYARTRCANRLSKTFKPPALAFAEPPPAAMDIFDPPDLQYAANIPNPRVGIENALYPRIEDYQVPPPPARTGATPTPPTPRPEWLSEAIQPQFSPIGAIAPALFAPLGESSAGGSGGVGGATVPEPSPFCLILALIALGGARNLSGRLDNHVETRRD